MRPILHTGPWDAGEVTTRATAVLAGNPSPMTLDGTNSWLLHEPGARRAVLVDPGPDEPGHLAALVATAERRGTRIALILLTHGHADHAEGAGRLHELTGAPVRALDPAHRLGEEGLQGGDHVELDGLELRVVPTPGHTSDSLTFLLAADQALLTGDTVLGRGTAVIAHPDGDLAAYLASLHQLSLLAEAYEAQWVLPGHGPARERPAELIADYRLHRQQRLEQVRSALDAGLRDLDDLLDAAYPDVPHHLRPAARLSLAAQVEFLRGAGSPPAG